MKYYLAIDIGASSGRHILGCVTEDCIQLEEVHRFQNGSEVKEGRLSWNIERLFAEILKGMEKCREIGKIPEYMGIDTWGVDFVLLDEKENILGNAVAYRDKRMEGMDKKVGAIIANEELYERTGIQKQIFNTIYQLMAVKEQTPEYMEQARSLLFIPDYLHFLLTGVKKMEYTNATTGQLIFAQSHDWDYELIDRLGYKKELFIPVSMPGTVVGGLKEEIQKAVGYNCTVILPATHDTGSAVLAVPTVQDTIYISSGTWSLMGIEQEKPNCSLQSCRQNFTNEGGYEFRFRYLKNIMGLWMIQSVKKEFKQEYSFDSLCKAASQQSIQSLVDCNALCFLAPVCMVDAVREYCRNTGQQVPETEGEIAAVIYNSLAKCYGDTAEEIEKITGKVYPCIHIVGGGANAQYLNELTAKYTKKKVYAGPVEATAVGNLMVQMIYGGEFTDLAAAKECIYRSFPIQEYGEV